jgi:hypothetical protein
LLMNQSVGMSLKQKPFDVGYLSKRDKIHHDINKLQPIVMELGIAAAGIIEKKFNVQFCLLSGRNRPAPVEAQKTDPGKQIILPGQEKR